MKTLKEILDRKAEIRSMLEGEAEVDLQALENELRELDETQEKVEKRQSLLKQAGEINVAKEEIRTVESFEGAEARTEAKEMEQRGTNLKENRAITVASGDLVLPKHTKNQIAGTFNDLSSLLDNVKLVPLQGGESYEAPYEIQRGTGDYTAEGADYKDTDVQFGYATINKTKITAYSEHSEEVEKLPAAPYAQRIIAGVSDALRKKITREILVGDGGTGHIVGIFSAQATAIDPASDLAMNVIDDTTLDNIIFSFGGDENVEDPAVLILNKLDLKAFATLRDGQDRKVYDVKVQGNTGTIDGVPFIINSACAPLATATDGQFSMAYGPLSNYELATFSPADIKHSTDFKFKQGIIAHRGSVFVGGNVVAHNGFLRVKKGTPEA